jgi:hypothetical protein
MYYFRFHFQQSFFSLCPLRFSLGELCGKKERSKIAILNRDLENNPHCSKNTLLV